MSRKAKTGKPGRGTLFAIGVLFFASGVIRIADGTGLALAREVSGLTDREEQGTSLSSVSPTKCATEEAVERALATLRERADELDAREKKIEYRMVSLQRAEQVVENDLKSLIEAEEALSATIALADGAAEGDISRLIAVYERMKPKDAAEVFDAMDPSFAAGFLARMRSDAAASVMAGLSPAKAYSVSVLLAGRNAGVPKE